MITWPPCRKRRVFDGNRGRVRSNYIQRVGEISDDESSPNEANKSRRDVTRNTGTQGNIFWAAIVTRQGGRLRMQRHGYCAGATTGLKDK